MTEIQQKAEQKYPIMDRQTYRETQFTYNGYNEYVYLKEAERVAYLAGAAEQSEEVERLKKENEDYKEMIKDLIKCEPHFIGNLLESDGRYEKYKFYKSELK